MTALRSAVDFGPAVRHRAGVGASAVFPDLAEYGTALYGAEVGDTDQLDRLRLVPPVFVPHRLEKLIDLGREPLFTDVELATTIGGLSSALPIYLSAFGSTRVASTDLGVAASRQAAMLGIPMVVGENVLAVHGSGRLAEAEGSLLARIAAYTDNSCDGRGGVVVQQSTEDADAEVWNFVYSDPAAHSLAESGRLAFELKVGQGAKPGLGGLTMLDTATAERLSESFAMVELGDAGGTVLRCGTPGTFTAEILRQQIRSMRNNFPRARVWVKLPPGRDVAEAAEVAWQAGADAVTIDGAEGGSGWAPTAFLDHVGLPLAECLQRIGTPSGCLLASGRMWEGTRVAKALALGVDAVGLGRAALLAVDADPQAGLINLVRCLSVELQMIVSALGKYDVASLCRADVWQAANERGGHD